MRRRPTDRERADALLEEWGAGVEAAQGYGYPPAATEPTVQGDRSPWTVPERYAQEQERQERLDRAVRRVADIRLRSVLWQKYVGDKREEARLADEQGVCLRTWRRRRDRAQIQFLHEYENLTNDVSIA